MDAKDGFKADEIGYWSEVKLEIIKKYATAYSTVFCAEKQKNFYHVYIDGFSGGGVHVSKNRQVTITGSPINALEVIPPFKEYHLIDLKSRKINALKMLVDGRSNAHVYQGDCNSILLKEVFPLVPFKQYRRGLCLLDPYGLHLNWEVIKTAGQMESIEIFLNFPVMDMNRNVLWRKHDDERIRPTDVQRMNAFWGDETWRNVAYSPSPQRSLFGEPKLIKESNDVIAEGFRTRLKKVAGFKYVPSPMPMRNSIGAIVYYLFFATQNETGVKIVKDIFDKHRLRGEL